MKNKIELKKTIIISLICIVVFDITFFMISLIQYNSYNNNYNYKISSILSTVKEKYPEVTQNELIEILNEKSFSDISLKEYGID